MGFKWLPFPTSALLLGYEAHDQYEMVIKAIATFLIISGANTKILFIPKVKILVLIKWSYRSPQLCYC